ncbi:MAG: hypothetical protein BroJett025_09380 [Patescibacteria group bacterium]|nr:MAG: hypothetical protein BroJett025_09380 [Patescibacteria group bacterium]
MKTVEFLIGGVSIQVLEPSGQRSDSSGQFPRNFGMVNDTLYRGSWPNAEQLNRMGNKLGLKTVVTLHSKYGEEPRKLALLRSQLPAGMRHYDLEVQSASSFIVAAQTVIGLEGPTYIHCSAGANRTGKTVLIAQILLDCNCGRVVTQPRLQQYLSQALEFGFDHEKSYKRVLEEALEILLLEGKIILAQ